MTEDEYALKKSKLVKKWTVWLKENINSLSPKKENAIDQSMIEMGNKLFELEKRHKWDEAYEVFKSTINQWIKGKDKKVRNPVEFLGGT